MDSNEIEMWYDDYDNLILGLDDAEYVGAIVEESDRHFWQEEEQYPETMVIM